MSRRVVITGLGPLTGLGFGIDALWEGVCAGRSAVARIRAFDPSGFDTQIGSEVVDLKIANFVPKSYRKATKVMARDIELAVAAADLAVRDAGLMTPGIDADKPRSYPGDRAGAQIGAGLIAADINELTDAFALAVDETGTFDIHKWGAEGMKNITPLWLLKYLPNMLGCHVTIIHDSQGPSNTITCGEASSGLSIGESVRVIQRDSADLCFCGGAESKINPMAFYRQMITGRLTSKGNDAPAAAVRAWDADAAGTALGEGGGIITVEAHETATARNARVYAEIVGFGASHTVSPQTGGLAPDAAGRGMASAIRSALREAKTTPDQIDLIVPLGSGIPEYDRAEVAAIRAIFGDAADKPAIWSAAPYVGNCGAGAGGISVAVAAKALKEQTLPARINCDRPIDSLNTGTAPSSSAPLRHALVFTTSLGGQNAALLLRKVD
jgi:3-oxoacyl-[acyl-carrier-protein] synthase II